jgi:hypothetical protein
MAASVFVSDGKLLNVSTGVAQLRLANLAHGEWLNVASQVAYRGGIDHLVRAGPLVTCPVRPGWYGSSSWIRCTGTAP